MIFTWNITYLKGELNQCRSILTQGFTKLKEGSNLLTCKFMSEKQFYLSELGRSRFKMDLD